MKKTIALTVGIVNTAMLLLAYPAAQAGPNFEHGQLFECHMDMWMGWKGPKHDYHWLNMMINQNECLIKISEHAIKQSDRLEVKQYSQDIIERSKKDIEHLKDWRQQWYGK